MKQNTCKILFYVKKTRIQKNGEVPIYLRITVEGKRDETALSLSVPLNKWDAKRGYAKGNGRKENEINQYLDAVRSKIIQIRRQLEIDSEGISAELILGIFTGKVNPYKSLIGVFNEHNKMCRELIPTGDMVEKTVQRYERTVRYLVEHMKDKYKMEDILLNRITADFLLNFEHFLKTEKKCGHNMAKKYLKCIRTVILKALANGWMKKDPYISLNMVEEKTNPVFLTYPELEKIMQYDFSNDSIQYVKDGFLFCCFTGLSFSDLKTLDRNHLSEDEDKETWIRKSRVKTDIKFNVPLVELPVMLIEKYEEHPKCKATGSLIPVPSNQKMNFHLKTIALVCGINKNLTTHVARHTFATLSLTKGVSIEVVSQMLGHTKISTTQHYARVLDEKTKSQMDKMKGLISPQLIQAV